MSKFNKIAVIYGGSSAERSVSLRSGKAVANGLAQEGYRVLQVELEENILPELTGLDAAFIALHGEYGEDGGVQKELERQGIPYVGTRAQDLPATYNKRLTKKGLEACGLPTAPYVEITSWDNPPLSYPFMLKASCQGSSVGVFKIANQEDWLTYKIKAENMGETFFAETFIEGREFTLGLGGDELLPIVEVKPGDVWYDYHAKYESRTTGYEVPAALSADKTHEMKALAEQAFQHFNCKDLARIDFIMDQHGALFILEINTIPGFTETSLLPKAAHAAGIGFNTFCGLLMERARI